MAQTKSKGKKTLKGTAGIKNFEVIYDPNKKKVFRAIRAARSSFFNKKLKKRAQCSGLKNFKLLDDEGIKVFKKTTISQQIPTQIINIKGFDCNSLRSLIIQLQKKYQSYGGVKLVITDTTIDVSQNLFDFLQGKKLSEGFSYSYQQIQDGIFCKANILENCKKLELKKKCFSEGTFWRNINKINANYYGNISLQPPKYFMDCFSTLNDLFKKKFPEKENELNHRCIFGGPGSIQGWHLNPYNLEEVNLNLKGGDKLWYFVPRDNSSDFYSYLSKLPVKQGEIPCIRSHFSTIIHPSRLSYLQSTIQKSNQLVITFPGVFHSYVNLGSNVCCVSSISTTKWLQERPITNCQCDLQLDSSMINRMKINQKQLSSSQGIRIEYESQSSSSNMELSQLSIRQFKVNKVNKSDYFFQLQPFQGKCYFKDCIRISLLHKHRDGELVHLTPKFNKDKNQMTRAFYNWVTDLKNTDQWSNASDNSQMASEQQQIFLAKPTGTFCRVCNLKFRDYLAHIKSKAHLKNIKSFTKKYQHQWMVELPHYHLINSILNKKNIKGFTHITGPKLSKKENILAKLILKAESKNGKNYFNILQQIKQLCEQIKYSPLVPLSIKKCTICLANTYLLEVLDSEWLVCNICNQKVHIECLKYQKCQFCQTKPQPQINDWKEASSVYIMGIQSLSYINDTFQIPPPNSYMNNEMQVKRYHEKKGIKYQRMITFYDNNIVQPLKVFYEPHIPKVSFGLENIYRQYYNGNYFPPIYIEEISKKIGVGVFASRQIAKNTFLCEYGGDVIPSAYAHLNEMYNMDLLQGACTFSSLIITVVKTSSLGPLLNHSDNPNCRTLRCYIGNCIRIIMYTIRLIDRGQQLTYNYNEAQKNYPTKNFSSFK